MSFIGHDYIFIHIPKTGGVSVKHTLNNAKQSGHETLHQLSTMGVDLFGTKYNPEHKIITCVRDPLTRFISAYYYCKDRHSKQVELPDKIEELIEQLRFRSDIMGWVHFRPMVEFVRLPEPAEIDIIRFEDFEKGFFEMFKQKVGKVNGTKYKVPKLDNVQKNIIRDCYDMDCKIFNY